MHGLDLLLSARKNLRRFLLTDACQAVARRTGTTGVLIHLAAPPMAPALGRIAGAERQLRRTAGAMEARFLESGSALGGLTSSSTSMVDNSAELLRLATGRREAEQIVAETVSVLEEPLDFLDRFSEQLAEHTSSLEQGCLLLGRLLGFESDLQAAVAPLRLTRTMFRVEAALLPEAERTAFLTLSDQIQTLYNQVRDSFGVEFAKVSEARTAMRQLVKQLGEESAVQREVLARERGQITAELEKLKQQLGRNSDRDVELTNLGRLVQNEVSKVIVALQSQDFVAQRTEHLFQGLEQIRTLGGQLEAGRSDRLLDDLARLRALLEIQKGQASSSLAHLEETAAACESATSEILATVNALDDECVFLKEFSDVSAAANGTIQVLLDIIEKTRSMVFSAVRLGADSLKKLQPVNSMTTQLSDSVERLAHQMNLVALNAQIQALQVGEGTGLEVLAAHTASVATETSRHGAAIRKDFERLREFLKVEIDSLTGLCEAGEAFSAHMESAGGQRESELHALRDAILNRLRAIGNDAVEVRASAEHMASASQLGLGETEGFQGMQASLSGMSDGLAEALLHYSKDERCLGLDDSGYTMAAERENHLKVTGGGAVAVEEEQAGVELF